MHPEADNSTFKGKYCCVSLGCYEGIPMCRKASYPSVCTKCNQYIDKGSNVRPASDGDNLGRRIFIHAKCPPPADNVSMIVAKKVRYGDSDGETEAESSEDQTIS